MPAQGFEILGKNRLFKNIDNSIKAVEDEGRKILNRATMMLENEAKMNVSKTGDEHPQVQTGRLRSSIMHETTDETGKVCTGKVGTNVFYGHYLEFGTVRMPAYPWLYPALKAIQPIYLKMIKIDLKQSISNRLMSLWRR